MKDFRRPHRGNYMRWKGCVWVIRQNLKGILTVEIEQTGRIEQMKSSAWLQACSDGKIVMVSDPSGELPEDRQDLAKIAFAALSATQQAAVERKRRYIEAYADPAAFYEKHSPNTPPDKRYLPKKLGRKLVVPFLKDVRAAFEPERKVPSFTAFADWLDKWDQYRDWRMMAPRFDRRGPNERSVIVGPLAEIVDAAVHDWLTPNQASIADLCDDVLARVDAWNEANPDEPKLKVSDRQIYRYVDQEVDRKDAALARKGKAYADAHFKPIWAGPEPDHVMEVVEVDHTQAEIEVCDDETGEVLGRPWITVAIDRCSRMVVGIHLHFEGQTTHAAMQALKNAMMPKGFLKKLVPKLGYDYPCCGVPVSYFFDRGADFASGHILEVGLNFDVRIDFAPGDHPELKGKIERFIRTSHEQVALNVKGGMPRVQKRRGDRRPDTSEATMAFSDFYERLWTWIALVYSKDFHEGIQCAPLDRWNERADLQPPRAPPLKEDVDRYLMRAVRCTVTTKGVRAFGLRWQGSAITDIIRAPGFRGSKKVLVRIDDNDVSRAFVTNPLTGELFRLKPVQPNYMRGLSMFDHELVKRVVKETRTGLRSEAELLQAKAELRAEALGTLSLATTGSKTRARIARFLGVGAVAPAGEDLGSLAPPPVEPLGGQPMPMEGDGPPDAAIDLPVKTAFDPKGYFDDPDDDDEVTEVSDR